jgi:hypothetical protein
MRALHICLVLAVTATVVQAASDNAALTLLTKKPCKVSFVSVDGHVVNSSQQRVYLAPGRHVVMVRVGAPGFQTAESPLEETWEANHHYTFSTWLSNGKIYSALSDLDKR